MDFTFLSVFTIICISIYFFLKKKRELRDRSLLLNSIKSHFTNNSILYPSIYQCILFSTGNDLFKKFYTILTLKKNFCISQILLSEQTEFVIFKGYLNKLMPNFFINYHCAHYGKRNLRKFYTDNIRRCTVYGYCDNKIMELYRKYPIKHIYCTYLPQEVKNVKYKFESHVFIECELEVLKNPDFFNELVAIFKEMKAENEKVFIENKAKYNEDLQKVQEYEKKGFVEKIAFEVENKMKKETFKPIKKINKKKKNK